MQPRIGEHQPRAFQHALLRPLRRGEHFPREPLGTAVEHDVGERTADIDGHANVGQQALHDRVGCHQDFRPVLTGAGGFIGQMGSAVAACAGRSS